MTNWEMMISQSQMRDHMLEFKMAISQLDSRKEGKGG